jgi:hypothetical protein
MRNQAMKRKVERGEALDVESMLALDPVPAGEMFRGTFRLDRFVDDVDYFVGSTEQWIWSIGRRLSDGAIFAAIDSRFYQNPEFTCLWLR